jgi:hypothetical protein
MFDINILLFSYDRNESSPFHSFKRWVPPPPNSPPMTDAEKDEVSDRRVCNPTFMTALTLATKLLKDGRFLTRKHLMSHVN